MLEITKKYLLRTEVVTDYSKGVRPQDKIRQTQCRSSRNFVLRINLKEKICLHMVQVTMELRSQIIYRENGKYKAELQDKSHN